VRYPCCPTGALASAAVEALAAPEVGASERAARAGLCAMAGWDGREQRAAISQPTLIIRGERDRSCGWALIEALRRTIPHASLAVLPECADTLHVERTALFHSLPPEFLRSDAAARM
jgi:2-hydroxy-6-oxonona-2,4-dienedioate hydrolase